MAGCNQTEINFIKRLLLWQAFFYFAVAITAGKCIMRF